MARIEITYVLGISVYVQGELVGFINANGDTHTMEGPDELRGAIIRALKKDARIKWLFKHIAKAVDYYESISN